MNDLIRGFVFIHECIDDLLILKKGYWTNHVQNLERNLNKFKGSEHKCNIEKSFFWKN